MKKTALLILLALCMALTVLLSSCFDEESYYTKTDTEALVKTLEEALAEKVNANTAAISALKTEYEAKIKTLEDADAALVAELAALKAAYEQKIAELTDEQNATQVEIDALEAKYATDLAALQKADADNAAAIEALEKEHNDAVTELTNKLGTTQGELDALAATYNASVLEINNKLTANETAINTAKTELQNKLDTLTANHKSELASINALVEALQTADTASEARIAELEEQVTALLSEHKHTFAADWVDYSGNANVHCESRLFYRICLTCNVLEWKQGSAADHNFETVTTSPTCQAGGYDTNTCTICGKVEITNPTEKVSHIYKTTYSHDGSYHWYDCQHCTAFTNKEEHTVDPATGYCTVCDQPITGSEGIIYDLSTDGTYAEVIGYEGTATKIVIADTYEGKPVTSIYQEVFQGNDDIVSVFIPASVTAIGDSAFLGCGNLKSVTLGENSKLTSIGSYAFSQCSDFGDITIPASVTHIGGDAFKYCNNLTSVTFGENSQLTSVGSDVFFGCTELQYTEYGSCNYLGTTSNPYLLLVGAKATGYSTYIVHESTRIIADSAFSGCTRLASVTFGENSQLTSIGNYAFSGCSSLVNITLPSSVTSIGDYAFGSCGYLATVYYGGTAQDWANISILSGNGSLTSTTRYYYSAEQPTAEGNYWRWVNGTPTPW